MTMRNFKDALKDTREATAKAKDVEDMCREYLRDSQSPPKE